MTNQIQSEIDQFNREFALFSKAFDKAFNDCIAKNGEVTTDERHKLAKSGDGWEHLELKDYMDGSRKWVRKFYSRDKASVERSVAIGKKG